MKITDLLSEKAINLHGKASSKEEAIIQLVDLMVENENISDKEAYKQAVLKREEEGTTGIGEGIAIPHGKTECSRKTWISCHDYSRWSGF